MAVLRNLALSGRTGGGHAPQRVWRQSVDDVRFGTHAGLPDSAAESMREPCDIKLHPTPGEAVAKIGGILAICLGLAILVHVLIAAPPMP